MTAVATKFLSVDPHMKNAFSAKIYDPVLDDDDSDTAVKFDISHKCGVDQALTCRREEEIGEAAEVSIQRRRPKEWELDVRSLISSRKWLQNYGLKKNRLRLNQILPSIGFKLSDEFDETLKRPISSRYGGGLFRQLLRPDGKTFNISCSKDKLYQLEKRLLQAMYLFRRRLEWLTTESRRMFGVIEERSMTIVLDIRNMSPQQFDQYRTALERVLREQVSQLAKFNLIRACEDIQCYGPECAPVSHDTIENAIQWMWNLDRLAPVSNTAAAEAVLRALSDKHNEAVYLFTEGTSIDSGKEILKDKVFSAKLKIPIHVVSFNCECSNTVKFLKEFVGLTGGKFHAYGVMELDAYEAQPGDGLTNRANIMLKRKTFGGIPPGAGVREDVVLVFEEMEEARNNLAQVRMLIENAPEPNRGSKGDDGGLHRTIPSKDEQYMSSKEWLEIYGLAARKLGLYDVLSGVAFKHQDGVIDIMSQPTNDTQMDAIVNQKLINARYCERFPIVRWKDGRVVHVQVTPDVHRNYEEKVQVALNKIQQRIDWLNQGSRSLFGTLVEDQMYILIDTSASMQPSLGFVKQKLFVLMQEQLRHKKKFNLVAFNSKAILWKDRLVDVSERSLQSAWSWVQNLSCWGSTNTYAAIQLAMADPNTEAIYLLTDGRPDQPPKSIIAQVQMQKSIPIHTISFNCNDSEANQFLYELAETTSGRYHYYTEAGPPVGQPEAWESVDIKLLKDEIRRGIENLDKLADLRDECSSLSWKKETDSLRQSLNSSLDLKETPRKSAMPPLDSKDLYRPDNPTPGPSSTPLSPRPTSSPPIPSPMLAMSPRHTPTPPPERPSSAHGSRMRGSGGLPVKLPRRPKSAKVSLSKKPLVAEPVMGRKTSRKGHTRTSLLRTLNSSGRFSPNEWLLPETKSLFQLQAERQRDMAAQKEKEEKLRQKKAKKIVKASVKSSKQWLAKHGLVAKRLTILDALGSTFVPHQAKYVSILDKYVMSKVFDEVLPIAHVSKTQQVRLVNPNGVNLKEYETKVKVALEKYKKRLDKILWEALPESAKEEFDDTRPIEFEENRRKILVCLEEADWPVREQDVLLLADEVARAEKFIRQSQALRKAAAGEDDDEQDGNSTFDLPAAGQSYESPRSARSKESRSHKSDASPPRSHKSDASPPRSHKSDASPPRSHKSDASPPRSHKSNASPPRSEKSESVQQRSKSIDSPRRSDHGSKDYEGLGQVIRSVDKALGGKVKETSEVIKTKVRIKLDTLKGQTVIARRDQDGLYYPGVVLQCKDHKHAVVRYDGGVEAGVLARNVIPVGGAVARPPLSVGDYVLIRVVYLDSKDECHVPAVIRVEPQKHASGPKFFTVVMYNGQKATTLRKHLVKISKERFELASMYIAEQQNEDREESEEIVFDSPRGKRSKEKKQRQRPDDKRKHIRPRSSSDEGETYSRSKDSTTKKTTKRKPRRRRIPWDSSASRDSGDSRERSLRRSSGHQRDSHSSSSRSRSRSRERSQSRERSPPRRSRSNSYSSVDDNRKKEEIAVQSGRRSRSRSNSSAEEDKRSDDNGEVSHRSRSGSNSSAKSYNRREEIASKRPLETKDELERLQEELLRQQEKQERQKKKLKKMAKCLSKQRKEIKKSILREIAEDSPSNEPVVLPVPEDVGAEARSPRLLELRKTLQHLRPGEEVLARWSDDGWYYRGIIRHHQGDYSYYVEDSAGFIERIWREDIISENDNPEKVFEIGDKVIAIHPDYSFSYAPGFIQEVNDSEVAVEFYGGQYIWLPWSEAYHITSEKYRLDVDFILKKENELIGAAVVARDDRTGAFFPGTVTKRCGSGRDYIIQWADGSESTQGAIHIFSAFTKRPNLNVGNQILACADPVHLKFLPGHLAGWLNDTLIVKFCDGETRDDIDPALCYWLGQKYYDSVTKYYRTHDPSYY